MDSQNYAVPLKVSRAAWDEVREKLRAAMPLAVIDDARGLLDMRGVLLQLDEDEMSELQFPAVMISVTTGAGIYDTAPTGALMPWKRGTEPHPGWGWAENLAQYDAGDWAGAGPGTFGWIRRL